MRRHLTSRGKDGGDHAQGLGRAALAQGLSTRDLAVIHHRAMVALSSHAFKGTHDRAKFFLAQAFLPLETAQRTTREALAGVHQREEVLRLHTAAMAKGIRQLTREIAQRKAAEALIRKGREHYQVLFAESQIMEKKLRLLTRQILTAQEEERKKISRELHDEVVQTLVGINVELSALVHGNSVASLKQKIAHTQRLVAHSVEAVHRFARELRPAVLDDLGLIPALHAYCRSLAARKKVRIDLTAFGGVEAIGNDKLTVLYRVAQEALTNVARHAQATQVKVHIDKTADSIKMTISDNGQSFSVRKILHAKSNKRLGLVGMRERVEMVGGNLVLRSQPGEGTTVCAEIPFTSKQNTP
ncbi:MAG TPA: sensor histidine kinase [Lacunisphaera sp.]|nr:sensor histidine kinase [Lacunisphaera sp.]